MSVQSYHEIQSKGTQYYLETSAKCQCGCQTQINDVHQGIALCEDDNSQNRDHGYIIYHLENKKLYGSKCSSCQKTLDQGKMIFSDSSQPASETSFLLQQGRPKRKCINCTKCKMISTAFCITTIASVITWAVLN